MSKPLYHFTAADRLPAIQREGITLGEMAWSTGRDIYELRPHCQALTRNGAFRQSWADPSFSQLPFRKDDVRLTISVPPAHRNRLRRWLDYGRTNRVKTYALSFYDPHNWRVFLGDIPPEWIVEIRDDAGNIVSREQPVETL